MTPKDTRPHYTSPVRQITRADCETLIRLALEEDAPQGDPTSEANFAQSEIKQAYIVSREAGILCGLPVVRLLCEIDAERRNSPVPLRVMSQAEDGQGFAPGDRLLELSGPLPTLLRLERPILNFLQYLSGISTTVAAAVSRAGPEIAVLDTRKTVPGYRRLAKYAVYCGGGTNHRIHLSDMAMIKDNHIAAAGGSITRAVQRVRAHAPGLPLEVEVDRVEQLDELLPLRPNVILLDNMRREQVAAALQKIRAYAGDAPPFVEVSGGWRPEQLSELYGLGPLGVSMGYLTHTTRFLDLSLEIA